MSAFLFGPRLIGTIRIDTRYAVDNDFDVASISYTLHAWVYDLLVFGSCLDSIFGVCWVWWLKWGSDLEDIMII